MQDFEVFLSSPSTVSIKGFALRGGIAASQGKRRLQHLQGRARFIEIRLIIAGRRRAGHRQKQTEQDSYGVFHYLVPEFIQNRRMQWALSIAPYLTMTRELCARRQHAAHYAALMTPYPMRLTAFDLLHIWYLTPIYYRV